MNDRRRITLLLILVVTGLFLFTACSSLEVKGKEVSFETPEIFRDTNLGAELPFIAYESEHQLIFYNYMGIFIYDLENEKMLRALIPSDLQFYHDQSTIVNFDIDDNTISIYKLVDKTFDYFYVYKIKNDKLYQYPIDQLKNQENPKVTRRMDTSDWSAWNLFYTSEVTGKTYYPFRSIAK